MVTNAYDIDYMVATVYTCDSDSDLFQPYIHIYTYLQCKQYDIAGRCMIVDTSLRLSLR